jgi:hypothetical protein
MLTPIFVVLTRTSLPLDYLELMNSHTLCSLLCGVLCKFFVKPQTEQMRGGPLMGRAESRQSGSRQSRGQGSRVQGSRATAAPHKQITPTAEGGGEVVPL